MSMLRDGLRAELPELFELAGRVRPLAVPRMPLWAVAIGALGVRTLTFQLLAGAHGVLLLFGLLPFRGFELTTVASYAAAIVFAFGAARWRGVLVATAAAVALWLEQLALGSPGRQLFCERSDPIGLPDFCDTTALVLRGVWPVVAGGVIGVVLRGAVRQGPLGTSALALAFGTALLIGAVGQVLLALFVGPIPGEAEAAAALSWSLSAYFAGAVTIGLIAGWWGRRRAVDAAAIAAYALLPWIPQLQSWLDAAPRRTSGSDLAAEWQLFVPAAYAAAGIGALILAAVARRSLRSRRPQ